MGAALGDQALGVFGLLGFRLDGFFLDLVTDIGRLVVALDSHLLGADLAGLALGIPGRIAPQVTAKAILGPIAVVDAIATVFWSDLSPSDSLIGIGVPQITLQISLNLINRAIPLAVSDGTNRETDVTKICD